MIPTQWAEDTFPCINTIFTTGDDDSADLIQLNTSNPPKCWWNPPTLVMAITNTSIGSWVVGEGPTH